MFTPNGHLDAAHQRLRHATSHEVNADAPPLHPSAPAQTYDAWQYLPQGPSPLPHEPHLTAQCSLSPPLETHGLTDIVGYSGDYSAEAWQIDDSFRHSTFQIPSHHLLTPPAYSDRVQPPQVCVIELDSRQHGVGHSHSAQNCPRQHRSVPNGLPLSPEDYLLQKPAHISNAGLNALNAPIWNVDGTGSNREDRIYNDNPRSELFYQTHLSEYSARYGASLIQPQSYQFIPSPAAQPRRTFSIASPPVLADHHGQSTHLPVL